MITLFPNAVFMCKWTTVYWFTMEEKGDSYFDILIGESRTEP